MWKCVFGHIQIVKAQIILQFHRSDQGLYCPLTESLITTDCMNEEQRPEPTCSKLMMLLVNVSLKLWSLNMPYMLIFLLKKNVSSFCICKSYSHIFSKNTCELDIVLTKTVNIFTTNKFVKLTILWTTGPWMTLSTCLRWSESARSVYLRRHIFTWRCPYYNKAQYILNIPMKTFAYFSNFPKYSDTLTPYHTIFA